MKLTKWLLVEMFSRSENKTALNWQNIKRFAVCGEYDGVRYIKKSGNIGGL
jgi:hypothetical protein